MLNFFTFEGPGKWFVILFALLLIYLILLIWINRNRPQGDKIQMINQPKSLPNELPEQITLSIWNIGYAGLGKDSDFITDGGKSWFPPSRAAVKNNLSTIQNILSASPLDASHLIMLQEVSIKSPLSYWVQVRQSLTKTLEQFHITYRPDISTWGLPWPLKIAHGTLSAAKAIPIKTEIIKLPAEPTFLANIIKRNYALLVSRFPIKNLQAQWVLVNLHLAAFDPNGATRFKQLDAVFAFAQAEYQKGNFVVLGGDWNMALTQSNFPHTTDMSKLFWLVTLPKNQIPNNWPIACDPNTPTVRTNYQPYVAGENYTAIIDGFIVSPNVKIEQVTTKETNFTHTDHQPVTASFSTKPIS